MLNCFIRMKFSSSFLQSLEIICGIFSNSDHPRSSQRRQQNCVLTETHVYVEVWFVGFGPLLYGKNGYARNQFRIAKLKFQCFECKNLNLLPLPAAPMQFERMCSTDNGVSLSVFSVGTNHTLCTISRLVQIQTVACK